MAGASFPSLDTERSFVEPLGYRVVDKRFATDDEALEACRSATAVMTDYFVCDAVRIATFEACKVICQYGVGLNQVDVPAATAAGIYVTHTPDYCREELGDHTMALILACTRRIVRFDRNVRAGRWDYNDGMPMRRLAACTLGLVGFGRAAQAVATRAKGFGMTILAHDPAVAEAVFSAAGVGRADDLGEVLAAADVLSIHVPLVRSTRNLIGAEELARLPDGAFVVNTSRGGVIDQGALHAEVASGRLAGAGLDVLAAEPPPPDEPLLACADVLVTPHTAFLSVESLALLQTQAATDVARVLAGQPPIYGVNTDLVDGASTAAGTTAAHTAGARAATAAGAGEGTAAGAAASGAAAGAGADAASDAAAGSADGAEAGERAGGSADAGTPAADLAASDAAVGEHTAAPHDDLALFWRES